MADTIARLYEDFRKKLQTRKERQTESWQKKMEVYNERVRSTLFDISTSDESRKNMLKRYHEFTEDSAFLIDQRGEKRMTSSLYYKILMY